MPAMVVVGVSVGLPTAARTAAMMIRPITKCVNEPALSTIARCQGFFDLKTRSLSSGAISSNGFMPAMRT